MIEFMLDTNICIYLIKKRPPRVVQHLTTLSVTTVGISTITLSELEFGAAKSARPEQNKTALALFLAPIEVLPYDANAALEYGRIRAAMEERGALIGALDLLIAAHALSVGCILVTNNDREFKRVPGLKIENWVTG